jgi:hypothetical protein
MDFSEFVSAVTAKMKGNLDEEEYKEKIINSIAIE